MHLSAVEKSSRKVSADYLCYRGKIWRKKQNSNIRVTGIPYKEEFVFHAIYL